MRQGLINDWGYIGACLANSDGHDQVEFFKAFVRECKSWGTKHQIECQLAAVNSLLSDEERGILSTLGYRGE